MLGIARRMGTEVVTRCRMWAALSVVVWNPSSRKTPSGGSDRRVIVIDSGVQMSADTSPHAMALPKFPPPMIAIRSLDMAYRFSQDAA